MASVVIAAVLPSASRMPKRRRAVCVTGGNKGTWELSKDLRKGCEVVVSTPGRLIDLVKAKATNLRRVTLIILDECDRMLSMGFEKQVTSIMENVRPDRQTLMFSATLGRRVEKVAKQWLAKEQSYVSFIQSQLYGS